MAWGTTCGIDSSGLLACSEGGCGKYCPTLIYSCMTSVSEGSFRGFSPDPFVKVLRGTVRGAIQASSFAEAVLVDQASQKQRHPKPQVE